MELRSGRLVGVGVGGHSHNSSQLAYHPLMNEDILRNVFAHLAIGDCKTLRLVHTTWLQELQTRWEDETVVKVSITDYHGVSDSDDDDWTYLLNQPTSLFPEGCRLRGKPIRNLRISDDFVNEISLKIPSSPSSKFWSIIGTSLKYLDLNKVKFPSSEDARKLLFELTPNLETLKLTSYGCAYSIHDDDKSINFHADARAVPPPKLKSVSIEWKGLGFPISFLEFFSHFPKIQEFELTVKHSLTWDRDLNLDTLFDAWITVRRSLGDEALNLTHLTLNDYTGRFFSLDDLLATKLCSLQFPLSQLIIRQFYVDNQALAQIIESHRGTLKSLTLEVGGSGIFLKNFPNEILPENLTNLRVLVASHVFPTWTFLKFTPNLQNLFVRAGDDGKFCEEIRRGEMPVLTYLTELHYLTKDVVSARTVKFLVKAMPNVTKLEMSVDAVGFEQICKGWKLREWNARRFLVEEDAFIEHVTLLTSLSKFKIYKCPRPGFGEVAIHEGVLKLRNLSYLVAPFSSQVSASSISLLKSQVRYVGCLYLYLTGRA